MSQLALLHLTDSPTTTSFREALRQPRENPLEWTARTILTFPDQRHAPTSRDWCFWTPSRALKVKKASFNLGPLISLKRQLNRGRGEAGSKRVRAQSRDREI